jgi:multimeric flavodoxin WrbA
MFDLMKCYNYYRGKYKYANIEKRRFRRMQILVLSGSRNRKGQTGRAIDTICKGIANAGGKFEVLFLTELKLERCRQCNDDGWGICRSEQRCIIEDDFASIVEKIKAADVLVFATPVYFGDLSENMRGFLDRYRRTRFTTVFRRPLATNIPGQLPIKGGGTPAIGYCYAGGSGNGTISCVANLERILLTCGFDVVDMIPARRQNLEMKLPLLESVGKWLVTRPVSGAWPPVATVR